MNLLRLLHFPIKGTTNGCLVLQLPSSCTLSGSSSPLKIMQFTAVLISVVALLPFVAAQLVVNSPAFSVALFK